MAEPSLTIALSRRAILAGATAIPIAVPIATQPLAQTLAALPEPSLPSPDERLLRRVAVAERLRKRRARLLRLLDRLDLCRRGPDGEDETPWLSIHARRWYSAGRAGHRADMLHASSLFHRYAAAVRGAVATPAHSLPGLQAKLQLAAVASRRGDARIYMYEDREWLDAIQHDVARVMAPMTPQKP